MDLQDSLPMVLLHPPGVQEKSIIDLQDEIEVRKSLVKQTSQVESSKTNQTFYEILLKQDQVVAPITYPFLGLKLEKSVLSVISISIRT